MKLVLKQPTTNTASKRTNTRQEKNTSESIAAVRATIERDFLGLIELQPRVFRLALDEAEALAWQSGFPDLFFPTLALEKARKAAAWHEHQKSVWQSTGNLAFAA